MSAAVLAARESSSVYLTSSPPASSVDAVPPAERPTFAAVGPEGPSEAVNGIARQPPLVHAVGAAVLTGWLSAPPCSPAASPRSLPGPYPGLRHPGGQLLGRLRVAGGVVADRRRGDCHRRPGGCPRGGLLAGRVWAVRLRLALFAFPTVALAVLVFFAGVGVLALVVWTLVEVGRAVHGSLSPPPPRRRPAA